MISLENQTMKFVIRIRKFISFDLACDLIVLQDFLNISHNEKSECESFYYLSLSFFFYLTAQHTHNVLGGAHQFERIKLNVKWIVGSEREREIDRERRKRDLKRCAHSNCQYMWSVNVLQSINWRTTVLHTHTSRFDGNANKREHNAEKNRKTEEQELECCFFMKRIQEL